MKILELKYKDILKIKNNINPFVFDYINGIILLNKKYIVIDSNSKIYSNFKLKFNIDLDFNKKYTKDIKINIQNLFYKINKLNKNKYVCFYLINNKVYYKVKKKFCLI
jgi:hypothetical protein